MSPVSTYLNTKDYFTNLLHSFDRETEVARERLREFAILKPPNQPEPWKFDTSQSEKFGLAAKSFYERFRSPELAELQILTARTIKEALTPLTLLQPDLTKFERFLQKAETPWIDKLNPPRSFGSITGLLTLGSAIRSTPYQPQTAEIVKSALGNWSTVPEDTEQDSLAREEFYIANGLNSDLLAIPEPVYTQALETAGIVELEILVPNADEVSFGIEDQEVTPNESLLIRRMSRAGQLINMFELRIRDYIHRLMTTRCGEGWEKKRTPDNGKMYADWEEKRRRATSRRSEQLALIHYADFTDYARIITRTDNWAEIFSSAFYDKDDLKISLRRLEQLRLIPMHSRPVTKSDLLTIGTETTRLLTAMGFLESE